MPIMTPFHLAYLSLRRHQLTTFIAVVAIAVAVACCGVLLRLYKVSDARFDVMGEAGEAVVGAKAGGIEILLGSLNGEGAFPDFLPFKLFESLRAQQSVQHGDGAVTSPSYIDSIVPFVYFAKYEKYRVIGTDASFYRGSNTNSKSALKFKAGEIPRAGEVVLGSIVATKSRLQVGDELKVDPWISKGELPKQSFSYKVSGILKSTQSQWDRSVFAPVESAHQVFSKYQRQMEELSIWGPKVLHYFLVHLRPGGFDQLASLINRRTVGQAIAVEQEKRKLKELSGVGQKIGIFVTLFVIFLGALTICSMLIARFDGMRMQIAVLRAMGYTRRELASWLLWEGFLLAVMGVTLGAILDSFLFSSMRALLSTALPPPELVTSSPLESAPVWAVALVTTVLSVVVPLIRLVSQSAHAQLRGW